MLDSHLHHSTLTSISISFIPFSSYFILLFACPPYKSGCSRCKLLIIIKGIIEMMERRPWTAYEDQILKNLFEKVKLNKWSLIARRMEEEYQLAPRTGKQCRQRYNNHLNPLMMKENWTEAEERLLFHLHDELGNKWAIIAAKLGGRTDNSVKNHFFAKLRKSMRKINKIINDLYKKQLKEVKLNVLYKIIEASEERFKKSPLCTFETSKYSCSLKNKILIFAYDSSKEPEREEFQALIKEIHDFGKNYKRKPKQLRRIASQGIELPEDLISYPAKEDNVKAQNEENSDSGSEDSEDQIVRQVPPPIFKKFQEIVLPEPHDKMNLRSNLTKPTQQQKKQTNVEMLLQNQGLLEQDEEGLPPIPGMIRRNTSSEFSMEGHQREVFFLDQSQGDVHLPTPLHFNHTLKKESHSQQLFG